MTMDANNALTRYDFRCFICQQKQVFHCEHDTPYRDQYLGIYDTNIPRDTVINSRRSMNEPKNQNNSTNNGGMNTGRQVNFNPGAHHQQNQKLDQTHVANQHVPNQHVPNQHVDHSTKANEQNQKGKSCVIL